MTREHAKKILPIIQAYADGKEVEYFHPSLQKWVSNTGSGFGGGYEYRIKPEPLEAWMNVFKSGKSLHFDLASAEARASQETYNNDVLRRCVHLREVL